jgi:hypothetical protein
MPYAPSGSTRKKTNQPTQPYKVYNEEKLQKYVFILIIFVLLKIFE